MGSNLRTQTKRTSNLQKQPLPQIEVGEVFRPGCGTVGRKTQDPRAAPAVQTIGLRFKGYVSGVWGSAAPGVRLKAYEVTFLRIRAQGGRLILWHFEVWLPHIPAPAKTPSRDRRRAPSRGFVQRRPGDDNSEQLQLATWPCRCSTDAQDRYDTVCYGIPLPCKPKTIT